MKDVEAGVVFSSVDTNPLKYIMSLTHLLTPLIFFISFYKIFNISTHLYKNLKDKKFKTSISYTHLVLMGLVIIYILFFSLSSRLTERWMLPIIPFLLVYSARGLVEFLDYDKINKIIRLLIFLLIISTYSYYSYNIVKQLQIGKPRVNAYLWTLDYIEKSNLNDFNILMYTNKGNKDPFGNIKNCDLEMFSVYESRGAQYHYPKNPTSYDFVILYSYLENNFENDYVKEKYPEYYKAWSGFIRTVEYGEKFRLLKSFNTTKMDLMGIPEILIYEKIK
ncbi:hypothetical protein K0B04_02595 [Patescibacteria group bacterium]|nr:hypothetical protein [Patescibacteria group bacterium]